MSALPSRFKSAMRADAGWVPTAKYEVLNESVDRGVAMGNAAGFDPPPPGPGLATVIVAVLALATSAAEIAAVNCDPLRNVAARGLPYQFTTKPDTKPVPFTVSVNAPLPGTTVVGTSGWFTNGTGFDCPNSEVARKTITLKAAKVNLFMFLPQIVDGNGNRFTSSVHCRYSGCKHPTTGSAAWCPWRH